MSERLNLIIEELNLRKLEADFLSFCAVCLGITEDTSSDNVRLQLQPWFSIDHDTGKVYTQVFSEYVQQKYRVALDFCAKCAGFESISYQEIGEDIICLSNNLFWFRDTHPSTVKWIMVVKGRVIGYGEEAPYSLTIDTMEDWLLDHIKYLSEIKRKSNAISIYTSKVELRTNELQPIIDA